MVRAPIPDLASGERRLEGAVAHYLARVLRLGAGDAFVGFDPVRSLEASAVVVKTDPDGMTVRFEDAREAAARGPRAVTWIQGLAKGDKCDAVVRDATELGATRIVVAQTERSVVRLDAARASARQARWTRIAQEAARQCGRSDAPAVEPFCAWTEAIAGVEPAEGARFCLWERATEPVGPALFEAIARGGPLAFACGPEGGLETGEVERWMDHRLVGRADAADRDSRGSGARCRTRDGRRDRAVKSR